MDGATRWTDHLINLQQFQFVQNNHIFAKIDFIFFPNRDQYYKTDFAIT